MDIFPRCDFTLRLPGNALRAGQHNEGIVDLIIPEPIERAEHVDIVFHTTAVAGYGSGKSRSVVTRTMFVQPLKLDLPGGIGAGRHEVAFALDLPQNLPPAYGGNDCSIRHQIDLRLDVDWAFDPKATFEPVVWPMPHLSAPTRAAMTVRSPDRFHEDVAFEISLDSTVVVQGEALTGRLALRTGHTAEFNHVNVSLIHAARVAMARKDVRHVTLLQATLPAQNLRAGQTIPFQFRTADLPPTMNTGFLDLMSYLQVSLDVSWWTTNRNFTVPIVVLPRGTHVLEGAGAQALLGGSRLAALAQDLAQRAGLRPGTPPTLVTGSAGMVSLAVDDASHGSEFAARERYMFPDLGLQIRSRPLGILPVSKSLAPPSIADRWAIQCSDMLDTQPLQAFFARILGDVGPIDQLELSDHVLSIRRPLHADDPARWLAVAAGARERARIIADAIAILPSPDPGLRTTWERCAAEEAAFLLPHLPAIVGIRRSARLSNGEQREFQCAITTVRGKKVATRIEIDLDEPIPAAAAEALHDEETKDDILVGLRSIFSALQAQTPNHLLAIAEGSHPDPRTFLPAIDRIVSWTIRARGERQADAPYR